jgi:hypothetical protein
MTARLDPFGVTHYLARLQRNAPMSKRKSNKSHKPDAQGQPAVAKKASTPKRAIPASTLAISEGDELQAVPETETRLPELPGQELDSALPPVPPAELGSELALPTFLVEPKLDVALPVAVLAEAEESGTVPPVIAPHAEFPGQTMPKIEPTTMAAPDRHAATGDATVSSPPRMDEPSERPLEGRLDRPLRAIAGVEAYQTLFMEMTRDNLDFAASLASMRSPLEIIDVAAKFAGRRIGMYGRFSRTVVDIAAGRQAPTT